MAITITHRINKGIVIRDGKKECQIRLRVSYCGNRMDLYTGLLIEKEKWIDTAIVDGKQVDIQ